MQCLLCQSGEISSVLHHSWKGELFHCRNCDLIFKSPADHMNWQEQKLRYDQHENTIDNPGYKEFFQQLLAPLSLYFPNGGEGRRALDWGSGPGPVLAELLRQKGFQCEIYDPVYQPQKPVGLFDLVTSTEAAEHFQEPRESLDEILKQVSPGGIFAGLTQFHRGKEHFSHWWYVKDPTHVVFYSEKTFQWWAQENGLEILWLQSPGFIFSKR